MEHLDQSKSERDPKAGLRAHAGNKEAGTGERVRTGPTDHGSERDGRKTRETALEL